MNKFAHGALLLAALGSAAGATDTGWSGLDQEINSLSASLAAQNAPAGPKVGGFIITSLDYVDQDDAGTPEDVLGFSFRAVRVEVRGDAGNDYSYKVSFDLGDDVEDDDGDSVGNVASLKDAYVDWKITDGMKGRIGRYKVPFVRSYLVSRQKLLFLERTHIGDAISSLVGRQLGVSVSGQFEMVNFAVNAQNGSDDILKDMFYNVRVTVDVMGDGVGMVEGAYGAGDAMGLQVGGAVGDDSALDNGVVWALEAALTSGPFSVHGEIADFDDQVGDATPWDFTASFMFTDMYELAVRYEDWDDSDETTAIGAAVNRYVQGHDIKWTLQWLHVDVDATDSTADVFSLGLTVGF